jgi:hypothetical protein
MVISGHNTDPVPDGLIQAGRDDEILSGMELGAHHVVVVARQHGQAVPGLPVPDPDSLRIEINCMFASCKSTGSYGIGTTVERKLVLCIRNRWIRN